MPAPSPWCRWLWSSQFPPWAEDIFASNTENSLKMVILTTLNEERGIAKYLTWMSLILFSLCFDFYYILEKPPLKRTLSQNFWYLRNFPFLSPHFRNFLNNNKKKLKREAGKNVIFSLLAELVEIFHPFCIKQHFWRKNYMASPGVLKNYNKNSVYSIFQIWLLPIPNKKHVIFQKKFAEKTVYLCQKFYAFHRVLLNISNWNLLTT